MSTPEGWSFELHTTEGRARRGTLTTPHGEVQTPAFMPVGTRATVKGLMPRDLETTGAEVCLANTYHLHIAPGDKIVKRLGGLHRMMAWDKTILTDSGGFQVFSLPKVQLDEEGVRFRFEKGGESVVLTPERSMAIQNNLGADIIMAFDVCVPFPSEYLPAREAVYRTERWLKRCKEAHTQTDTQALFGIVQGSTYEDLRRLSAELTCQIDLPGYAIGGVSVGEGHTLMMDVIDWTEPIMPTDKPRYLMGVGYPEDIIEAVARGIDMFDCVLPSRYGRSGVMFTRKGRLRVTNARYRNDRYPIDTQCQCYTCQNFSRGYVNHLLNSKEILGSTLGTLHNITFYQDLMRAIRTALDEGTFESFRRAFLAEYLSEDRQEELGLHFVSRGDDDASDDLSWDTEHSVIPPSSTDAPVALESHQARDAQDDTTLPAQPRSQGKKRGGNRGGGNSRGGGGNSRGGNSRGGNSRGGGGGRGGKKGGKKQD